MHRLRAALIALASLSFTTLAAAASPPDDQVTLKGGGFVRGHVMENSPTKGVAIQLADGSTKHIDAEDIESVRIGGEPSAKDALPPLPAAPAAPVVVAPVVTEHERPPPSEAETAAYEASFHPHVRGGLAFLGGGMVAQGYGGGSGGAGAFGFSGRIGIQLVPDAAIYYEPALTFGVDHGVVMVAWHEGVAEWSPDHLLLAGGLGIAPMCVFTETGSSGCTGSNFSTVARLGYRSGIDHKKQGSNGFTIAAELRTAFLPNGAILSPTVSLGWDIF